MPGGRGTISTGAYRGKTATGVLRRSLGRGARLVLRRVGRMTGEGRIVTTGDGRKFQLELSDPDLDLRLLLLGSYEPWETRVLRQVLRPGDMAADVGANFGWYTTLFASIVGSEGSVHSFEPNPAAYRQLEENVKLNPGCAAVFLNECAVGASCGSAAVHVFDGLSPARASLNTLGREDYTRHECGLVSLDSYFGTDGSVRPPNLVKCDVEGSEMAVLQGSTKLLSSGAPPIWLLEINEESAAAFGYCPADLLSLVREAAAYSFYRVGPGLTELGRVQDCVHGDNILCVPDPYMDRVLHLKTRTAA